MKKLVPYIYLIISGLIYTLGYPNILNIYIPFASIAGLSYLIHTLINQKNFKQRVLYFLLFNLTVTLFSFYWITNTLIEFGNLPFIIAALMNTAFSLIFNPQIFFLILLIHFLERRNIDIKTSLHFLYLSCFLTLLEYFVPQQFPVLLGQPWIIFTKHLGLAPIFGLPLYSFFSYVLCFEVHNYLTLKKVSKLNLVLVGLFIILNPLTSKESEYRSEKINARLVQANISNFMKVESESGGYASSEQVLQRYFRLSIAPSKEPVDIIIWPETAYPFPLTTDKENISQTSVPDVFTAIYKRKKTDILFGGYDHKMDSPDGSYFETEYNAGFLLRDNQLKQVYRKQELIPFGETLPLGPFNKKISEMVPALAFFARGTEFPTFQSQKETSFFTTICYELLRPEFIRKYLINTTSRPDYMINLTNDSWYGNTVEPEQHLFLARWRALEFRMPILRSTNTGISVYINEFGEEIQRLEYDITGNLDVQLDLLAESKATIYERFGILGTIAVWILIFFLHIILKRKKNETA